MVEGKDTNVKQPSQVYLEGHASNIAIMRLKGDSVVNTCLDSKIKREAQWKKKSSISVKCNQIVAQLVENEKIVLPKISSTSERHMNQAKREVKKSIQAEIQEKWNSKVQKLVMQGNFTKLLIEEEENVTWQSIANKLPRNVLAFATRLGTNSLPRYGERENIHLPVWNTCTHCKHMSSGMKTTKIHMAP